MLRRALTIGVLCALANSVAAQSGEQPDGGLPIPAIPVQDVSGQSPSAISETTSAGDNAALEQSEQSNEAPTGEVEGASPSANTTQAQPDISDRPITEGRVANTGPDRLTMEPGVNQIVEVATGHLNRLITPFEEPAIETADLNSDQTQINGRVVLVSVEKKGPVTMFIRPKGQQEPALSLTLVAKPVPPREIHLELDEETRKRRTPAMTKQARQWEESQPYEETLRELFTSLARGQIPSGYNMREPQAGDPRLHCSGGRNDYLAVDVRQVVQGARIRVSVAKVENPTDHPIELREPGCYRNGTLAVAAWPNPRIKPGESVELFAATRIDQRSGMRERQRPSVLDESAAIAEEERE